MSDFGFALALSNLRCKTNTAAVAFATINRASKHQSAALLGVNSCEKYSAAEGGAGRNSAACGLAAIAFCHCRQKPTLSHVCFARTGDIAVRIVPMTWVARSALS